MLFYFSLQGLKSPEGIYSVAEDELCSLDVWGVKVFPFDVWVLLRLGELFFSSAAAVGTSPVAVAGAGLGAAGFVLLLLLPFEGLRVLALPGLAEVMGLGVLATPFLFLTISSLVVTSSRV